MKTMTAIFLTLLAATASAQDYLEVETTAQKQEVYVNEAGEEATRMVVAERVLPGETVYFTVTFTNISDEVADDVVITNPIAEDLVYVDGSAFGPGTEIQFSVDGATFAAAGELTVSEDGATRAAKAADYTHVRWVMQNDLAAGAQGTVRFAAVLK
jgi:uncharacterized repeat protein (TIGR01451 family)